MEQGSLHGCGPAVLVGQWNSKHTLTEDVELVVQQESMVRLQHLQALKMGWYGREMGRR